MKLKETLHNINISKTKFFNESLVYVNTDLLKNNLLVTGLTSWDDKFLYILRKNNLHERKVMEGHKINGFAILNGYWYYIPENLDYYLSKIQIYPLSKVLNFYLLTTTL